MNNKLQKKRLCWNCESQVSIDVETCPICGVSVVPAYLEGAGLNFAPPYSLEAGNDFAIPKSPYGVESNETSSADSQSREEENEGQPATDEFKKVLMTVLFLLTGSVLFIFSLALALFSQNGILKLQWDGSHWFIYLSLGLLLIVLGWRFLMKLDDIQ